MLGGVIIFYENKGGEVRGGKILHGRGVGETGKGSE